MQVRGSVPDRSGIKEELDTRFRASLLAYFLRRTGSPQEAEDLTQETFARLIGSNTFEKADEANAFVFRVAATCCGTGRGPRSGSGGSRPCRWIH